MTDRPLGRKKEEKKEDYSRTGYKFESISHRCGTARRTQEAVPTLRTPSAGTGTYAKPAPEAMGTWELSLGLSGRRSSCPPGLRAENKEILPG